MTRLLETFRHTARQLDVARGPGTARSDAIGMVFTLGLAALCALGLAIIGGA